MKLSQLDNFSLYSPCVFDMFHHVLALCQMLQVPQKPRHGLGVMNNVQKLNFLFSASEMKSEVCIGCNGVKLTSVDTGSVSSLTS